MKTKAPERIIASNPVVHDGQVAVIR